MSTVQLKADSHCAMDPLTK